MSGSGWIISMRLSDPEYEIWEALKEMAPSNTWAGAQRYLLDDPFIRARINEMIDDYRDYLGG